MITTMTGAAVLVTPPTWLRREQFVDGCDEILITPRPHFDHGDTGGGVGNEDRQQAGLELRTEPDEV